MSADTPKTAPTSPSSASPEVMEKESWINRNMPELLYRVVFAIGIIAAIESVIKHPEGYGSPAKDAVQAITWAILLFIGSLGWQKR